MNDEQWVMKDEVEGLAQNEVTGVTCEEKCPSLRSGTCHLIASCRLGYSFTAAWCRGSLSDYVTFIIDYQSPIVDHQPGPKKRLMAESRGGCHGRLARPWQGVNRGDGQAVPGSPLERIPRKCRMNPKKQVCPKVFRADLRLGWYSNQEA